MKILEVTPFSGETILVQEADGFAEYERYDSDNWFDGYYMEPLFGRELERMERVYQAYLMGMDYE